MSEKYSGSQKYSVLGEKGGPNGLGDPEDKRLRTVEKEIIIPQRVRQKALNTRCVQEKLDYIECCKKFGLLLTFQCKPVSKLLIDCLEKSINNKEFRVECTHEYLKERSEYRKTGESKSQRRKTKIL